MCWILYKEEGCEHRGLGFTVPPGDLGTGHMMLRLGCAKPVSWGSFWAILTLVGLATRAGEWAVGGVGVGVREVGQDLPALAAHREGAHREGAVFSGQGKHRVHSIWEGSLPQRGGGSGTMGGSPNDKKALSLSIVQAAGSKQRLMGYYLHSGPLK